MPAETATIKLTATISLSEVAKTKEFTITLKVVNGEEPEPVTESLTITAKTGVLNGKSISWTGTNFTVTNNQDKSTTAIRTSDTDHFRAYAKSQLVFSAKNDKKITKIVVTCTSGSYATALKNSVGSAATVSGSVVTITLDGSASEYKYTMGAQTRFKKVELTCQ